MSPNPLYLTQTNLLAYTVAVTNAGALDFSGCVVTDTLPVNLTFVSATPSRGATLFTNNSVIWTLSILTNHTAESLSIVMTNLTNTRVTNRATVNLFVDDANPGNNAATVTNVLFNGALDMADLRITKTDSPDPVFAGTSVVTYTIAVTNLGPSNSVGTVITDRLPGGLSFSSPRTNLVVWYPFATNEAITIADATGLGHTGYVTSALPVSTGYLGAAMSFDGNDDFIHVPHAGDLVFSNGNPITISAWIRVASTSNWGTIVAKGRSAGTEDANYAFRMEIGGRLTFYYRNAALSLYHVRQSSAIVFTTNQWYHVAATYAFGQGTNIFLYVNGTNVPSTWTSGNGNDAPFLTTAPLWLGAIRNAPGVIAEEWNGLLDDVRIYRRMLSSSEINTMSSGPGEDGWIDRGGGQFEYSVGALAAGSSTSVTFTINTSSPGTFTNRASVEGLQIDTNLADNVDLETTTVLLESDLGITKSDTPDPAFVGNIVTYTLVVTNGGPTFASSVVVTDSLPQGVTLNAGGSTAGSFFTNGIVTYNLGTQAPNSSTSLTIQVTVSGTNTAAHITNSVTVSSGAPDTNLANNVASQVTTLQTPQADLLITNTDNIDPVFVGNALTYTVIVTNRGPDAAPLVVVTDSLPAGVTFNAGGSTAGGVLTGSNLVYTLGTRTANSSTSLTIQVIVSGTNAAAHITNNVSVSTGGNDTNLADNAASQVTTLSQIADLSVTKTDSVDPLPVGDFVTYSIVVLNLGPSLAANVVVTDAPPSTLSFTTNGSTPGLLYTNGLITYSIGNLAAGSSTTLAIRAQSPTCASGLMTNTASATTTTPETNLANNASSQTTSNALLRPPQGLYDFSFPFSSPPSIFIHGQDNWIDASSVQYTPFGFGEPTAIRNTDNSIALPIRYNNSRFSVPTFTTNMTDALIQFDATFSTATSPDRKMGFYLRSSSAYGQGCLMQAAGLVIPDSSGSDYDLRAAPVTFADNEWIRLRLVIDFTANGGDGSAVLYYRNLSDGETTFTPYVTNTDLNILGLGANANPVLWTGIVGRLDSFGPHIDNLQVSECDLGVAKFDNPDPVEAGSNLVYTLIVSNNGPMIASGVSLVDHLPAGMAFVSAVSGNGSCTQDGCLVRSTLNDIPVGAAATVTVTMTATGSGIITNRAAVQSSWYDPLQANNEIEITTSISPGADVRISQTDSADPVSAGASLTYTIVVTNAVIIGDVRYHCDGCIARASNVQRGRQSRLERIGRDRHLQRWLHGSRFVHDAHTAS